tara:strand:+ start:8207 stop:8419 length:213 start_codon:yes stop_codon:yes gene_type:complete
MFKANRNKLISVSVVLLVAIYAWLAHKNHVIEYWEYIFFALFIGLHFLMHGGHGHTHGADKKQHSEENIS